VVGDYAIHHEAFLGHYNINACVTRVQCGTETADERNAITQFPFRQKVR
jgi:hypothetical protein